MSTLCLIRIAAVGTVGIVLTASNPADAFTLYTDRAAWNAAVAGNTVTTETFNTSVPATTQPVTFDNGVVSTNSDRRFITQVVVGTFFGVPLSQFSGGASTTNTLTPNKIRWQFPAAVVTFGADWFRTVGDINAVTVNGNFDGSGLQTASFNTALGAPGTGFLGIVGNAPFSQIVFRTEDINGSNAVRGFDVDNLSLAIAPTTPPAAAVPEPMTMSGLAIAGAGLAAARRKSKQSVG